MPEDVKYEMSLSDLVTPKLDRAEEHAQKFETRLGSVQSTLGKFGEKVLQVGEYLGISFAIIKFEEFFTKGTEMVEEQDKAVGQLDNTLLNVGERAGLTGEQLVSMAERMQHNIPFSTAAIVEMETALSRFGNMTPGVYQQVLAMSADIATALKRNGTEVATTLGRIMEAPAENGRLLRQLNVTLTGEQRKYLVELERTGQVAKAQTFIMQELATKGYGGAAAAAANTDPLFKYNKVMYELQIQIGEAGIWLKERFAGPLEWVANLVKATANEVEAFTNYLKNNMAPILNEVKNDLYALAGGITAAAVAYAIAYPQTLLYVGALVANSVATGVLSVATAVMTAAQWALNVALDANPIGLVVIGIGALVTGIIYAYHHFVKFRAILSGVWAILGDIIQIAHGFADVIIGAFTFDSGQIKKGLMEAAVGVTDIMGSGGKKSAFNRAYDETIAEGAQEDAKSKHESTMGKQVKKGEKPAPGVAPPKTGTETGGKTKVSGTKITTINIKIEKLGCDITFKTTNVHESAGKIHGLIVQAMTAAVNDSQLVLD